MLGLIPALTALACCAAPSTVVVTETVYVPAPSAAAPPSAAPTPRSDAVHNPQQLLEGAVAAAQSVAAGSLGVAVVGPDGPLSTGMVDPTPAWSTIKVPIAIAALRSNPELIDDARLAITVSDNAAAERLYAAAGPQAVDTVLYSVALTTGVNTAKVRPEFSTFGQTQLSVIDEAQLANGLACSDGAAPVIALMGQIDPSQAYGLGAVGALYKGGWGPDTTGAYDVRQFGWIPRGDGSWVAVALTARPADGTYASGQAMLTAAAQYIAQSASVLPSAACQPQ